MDVVVPTECTITSDIHSHHHKQALVDTDGHIIILFLRKEVLHIPYFIDTINNNVSLENLSLSVRCRPI